MSSDKVKRIRSLESLVNPFATQQHPARGRQYKLRTPCVQPDTFLSYNFTFIFLSFSGEGRRQHLLLQQRYDAGRFPHHRRVPTLKPGGTLVAIFDPTTGIIRPVHRAYLCHAHSGEIPLFESHLQRWNISLSEHHSQAPPSLEHKLESPATWNRSLFGPLPGDIKRSFHVSYLFHPSSPKPSTSVVKPVLSS